MEKIWFDKLNPKFYGLIPSGESSWHSEIVFTEDVKQKISIANQKPRKEAPYGRRGDRINRKIFCLNCGKESIVSDSRIRFCGVKCGALFTSKEGRGRKRFISKEELQRAIINPTTYVALAEIFGVHRETISKYIKEYGLEEEFLRKVECQYCGKRINRNFLFQHFSICRKNFDTLNSFGTREKLRAGGLKGAHQTHHVNMNLIKDDCLYCSGELN